MRTQDPSLARVSAVENETPVDMKLRLVKIQSERAGTNDASTSSAKQPRSGSGEMRWFDEVRDRWRWRNQGNQLALCKDLDSNLPLQDAEVSRSAAIYITSYKTLIRSTVAYVLAWYLLALDGYPQCPASS